MHAQRGWWAFTYLLTTATPPNAMKRRAKKKEEKVVSSLEEIFFSISFFCLFEAYRNTRAKLARHDLASQPHKQAKRKLKKGSSEKIFV